jgi:hypothetical protein
MLRGMRWLVTTVVLWAGTVAPLAAWGQGGADALDARVVGSEREREAQALYRAGNELFINRSYAEALAKYEAAVGLWDHPAIRYNMAECYISLVQPLQAYEQLELALAHGKRPFASAPELYDRGLQLRERLLAQLGHLKLVAKQPTVRVTLDGKRLVLERGAIDLVVSPGAHELVAKSPGFLTDSQSIVLSPNERRELELVLAPAPVPRVERRRWHRWFPWAVAGAGAALVVAGTPLMALADASYRDYEQAIAGLCSPTRACDLNTLPAATRDLRTRGDREKVTAQVLWSTGGAVLAAGAILTLLNQPRMVELEGAHRLPVQAEIGPQGASLTIGWRY